MQLPMKQKSRKILRKVHLPSASALNNITCPHLTSVPRQMRYAVFWLAYTPFRQAGSTLTSTWGPIFLPQNSLEVSSNLPLIFIQGKETSLSVNESMDLCFKWRADISVVWSSTTPRNAARGILFLLQGVRQPYSTGALAERFISEYLKCIFKHFMSASFLLAIAAATIHSASANATSNFNSSA